MAKLLSGTRIYGTANVDTTIYIGNTTVNTNISAGSINVNGTIFVTNSTQTIIGSNLTISNSVSLTANGSTGSSGDVLTSNGTAVYWATPSGGTFDYGLTYAIKTVAF